MTLCIVDMQPYFETAQNERTIKGVLREIKLAKKRGAGIVVLEYVGCGKTDRRILDELLGYKRVAFSRKKTDDGSYELVRACMEKQYSLKKLRVCGVNACFCIYDTIEGFKKVFPSSQVVAVYDAINCSYERREQKKTLRVCADKVM